MSTYRHQHSFMRSHPHRGRVRSRAAAGVVVLALVAVACGSDDATSKTDAPTGTSATPGSQAAPADSAAPATSPTAAGPTGTLTVAIAAALTNMDFVIKADGQRDQIANGNVFETLTQHGPDMSLIPMLATEWSSDGANTWTFKLQDGVTFSNGDEFGSDDVVSTISTIIDPAVGAEETAGTIDTVASVSAVDPLTVQIVTKAADPALPARLTRIGMASAGPTAAERAETLIGTGPYEQTAWDKADSLTLKARSDYWGAAPKYAEVKVLFRAEASVRLAALESGEIDLAQDLSPELAGSAPAVKSAPLSQVAIVRLNARKGPLQDPNLRLAVNYAIDRQTLVDTVYGGFATLPKAQAMTIAAFGSDPDLEDFPFDPDKARDLVAKAGGPVTLTLSGSTGRSLKDQQAAEAIVSMLQDVGFTVNAEFPEVGRWVDDIFAKDFGGPDLVYIAHGNEVLDPAFTAGLYFACDGSTSRFCDPATDSLIKEAGSELDPTTRAGLYKQLWTALKDGAAFAAIANLNSVWGATARVQWQPRQDGFLIFNEVALG
jgi:peptide/nickel transport system substrate-binding protein